MQEAAGEIVGRAIAQLCGVEDLNTLAVDFLMEGYQAPDGFTEEMSKALHTGHRDLSWRGYTADEAVEAAEAQTEAHEEDVLAKLVGLLGGKPQ